MSARWVRTKIIRARTIERRRLARRWFGVSSATIVRPAKMVGVEDRFLNVFGEHSRKYPAVPIIDGGDSKHQPVFVDDVAVAVRQIVHDELTCGKTYELAGNKEYTVDELAKLVLRTTRSRRSTAYIPGFIMRALSCPHEFLLRAFRSRSPPRWV